MTTRESVNMAVPDDPVLTTPMMRALLQELAAKLALLAEEGRPEHIDLRRLPLPPEGLTALKNWLGQGEIEATVRALGVTTIRETAVAGVWWVRHAKLAGDTLDEHLEITPCPALLMAHADDIRRAAHVLEIRLASVDTQSVHESPASSASRLPTSD